MLKQIFFTGGIASTNGWVFDTGKGIIVADAPEGIADWLESRGLKPTALLLTHQHFDHVQDAAALKTKFGCPIYAFAPYSTDLTLERLYGAVTGSDFSVPPYEVDHLLEGKALVEVAGVSWKLLHIPGHSPDSLCFYSESEALVIGGDVLFAGGIGRTDFPGGSTQMLLSGIKSKLMVLPDATRVVPGHGPETTVGDEREGNPYLE